MSSCLLSLADALAAVEQADDLSAQRAAFWPCALRRIAEGLRQPLEALPANWEQMREPVERLQAFHLQCGDRTLANYKSGAKAALLWFANPKHGKPGRRTAASDPSWKALFSPVTDPLRRQLANFVRYCSDRGIAPAEVSETVLDSYFEHRAKELDHKTWPLAERRRLARAWNACADAVPGWPQSKLALPDDGRMTGPDWTGFPLGLQRDIESYMTQLSISQRSAHKSRVRAAKASSIRTRRAELLAFARRAVALGVPMASLTSLKALLDPEIVWMVLDKRWEEDGDNPTTYTIDLSVRLYAHAQNIGLDQGALEALRDIRERLEGQRNPGMTDKNIDLITHIHGTEVWRKVVKLPSRVMQQARTLRTRAPTQAALQAQLAAALAIWIFAPVRPGNMARIRIGENLIRPGGLEGAYWLTFAEHEVKNRKKVVHPLDDLVTPIIDEYLNLHRSALLNGSRDQWLFPGKSSHKSPTLLSQQTARLLETHTGVRVTGQQMRHVAMAIINKYGSGNMLEGSRLLGHKRTDTTLKYYSVFEELKATEKYGEVISSLVIGPDEAL